MNIKPLIHLILFSTFFISLAARGIDSTGISPSNPVPTTYHGYILATGYLDDIGNPSSISNIIMDTKGVQCAQGLIPWVHFSVVRIGQGNQEGITAIFVYPVNRYPPYARIKNPIAQWIAPQNDYELRVEESYWTDKTGAKSGNMALSWTLYCLPP